MNDKKHFSILEKHTSHGGTAYVLSHDSSELGLPAKLGMFLPVQALQGKKVPALYVLSGLTCTYETFLTKSGILQYAAERGIAIIAPDTSPRGECCPDEVNDCDIGSSAGYYVDASASPWNKHYRMASYLEKELPFLIQESFAICSNRRGITGHSMGGMGALLLALRNPSFWHSVSAFAPISSPSLIDWGHKATHYYFGGDAKEWESYDPCLLLQGGKKHPHCILVDQGTDDEYFEELQPQQLEESARHNGQNLLLRYHEGYDHSYWFVQTFVHDHILHHANLLGL